jgi:hypothetical protein
MSTTHRGLPVDEARAIALLAAQGTELDEAFLVRCLNLIAEQWHSLPDDHPAFDGGRHLLAAIRGLT